MSKTPSGATLGVFTQKMEFDTKTAFATFYSLVSSSQQTDGISIRSLPEGVPNPMAAPLTIWWG